ncbi:MAG: hypothetical protein KKH61_20095 [Gammaproteobacteria bacterium]|nr:hypothetical protein [Gammaproteobacteria bacterium]
MEVWAAFVPPLVAVGIIITVYFLAKEVLGSRGYALIAALLTALLPTELFHRTMLGFTDHHMFEVLFTSLSLLFVLKLRTKFVYCVPLGMSLGLLFLTWAGAAFIMVVLTVGVLAQVLINYIKNQKYVSYGLGFSLASLIALSMFLPYRPQSMAPIPSLISLVAGCAPLLFVVLERRFRSKLVFLLVLLIGSSTVLIVAELTLPIVNIVSGIFGYGSSSVVSEMTPLTIYTAFTNFGLVTLLGPIGFVLYLKDRREYVLPTFVVLTVLATIAHVRYGYYSAVPLSIFAAYFIYWVGQRIKPQVVVTLILVLFMLMTSLTNVIKLSTYENDITPDMYRAMVWLRENTLNSYAPEDFSYEKGFCEAAFYEELDRNADYLVLTLWDYNSWLIYAARRSPATNAYGYHYKDIMQLFIDGTDPSPYIKELYGRDIPIRYIVIDDNMLSSNWLEWSTGYELHEWSYINKLWNGKADDWYIMYSNNTVEVLQHCSTETIARKDQ